MLKYLELCKWAGTGSSGLISKCDRLINALTFVRLQKTAPDAVRKNKEIRNAVDKISTWKRSMRKEQRRESVVKMVREEEEEEGRNSIYSNTLHVWARSLEICHK